MQGWRGSCSRLGGHYLLRVRRGGAAQGACVATGHRQPGNAVAGRGEFFDGRGAPQPRCLQPVSYSLVLAAFTTSGQWGYTSDRIRSVNTPMRCPRCTREHVSEVVVCDCGYNFTTQQVEKQARSRPTVSAVPDPAQTSSSSSSPRAIPHANAQRVMTRYTDAYRVAGAIVGVGGLVKTLGVVAAAVTVVIGLGAASTLNSSVPLVAALPVALVTWLLLWALGVLVAAQGELLKANVDGAVNTSPFLLDDQRAEVMSLF